MAYSDSFPAIRPSFQFNADAGRLDPRISYSRSTTGTYFGTEKHLSSENLLTHSNDVSSAYSKNGLTETGGQAAPDGGTDAYKLTEDSATGFHRIYYAAPVLSSGSLTVSCYVKYIGRQWVYIRLRDSGAAYRHVWFDVQNGTKGTEETNMTGSITASGGGYYKLTATASSVYVLSADVLIGGANADGNTQYTGSGADAFAVWGIQASTTGETVLNETSGQIHRAYAPTLQTAAINAPRFEHSASDSASEGLLIEGSSTNLVSYSESFSNQTINNSTLTEGAAVGPDGTLNANLLVPTSTGSTGRAVNLDDGDVISHTSGNNYAYSIFAKAAGYNYLQWVGGAYFGYTYCNFDLSNGTVGNKSGSVTGSVESVGNDWYRLTVVAPATTTNNTGSKGIWQVVTSSTAARGEAFTGNDYSGVLLTMAQCELSSFSSSYIRSDSGSAAGTTRAADSASADTSSFYTGGPVSLVAESSTQSPADNSNNRGVVDLSEPTTSNNRVMIYNRGAQAGGFFVNADNVQQGAGFGGITDDSYSKVAVSVDTNSVKHCVNGGTVTTDTSAVIPDGMTKLFIGQTRSGSGFGGHIKRVAIYPALSDTNLQALTS